MTWKGSRGWTAALALVGGLGIALAASPADAKDEFEDGFKSELGRIAAHRVVYAGGHILGAVIYGDRYVQAEHREYDRHHRYDDDHYRHRGHDRHHRRHHWSRVQYRKHYYKHRHRPHGSRHKHHYDHDPHETDRSWHYHGRNRCNVAHGGRRAYHHDD